MLVIPIEQAYPWLFQFEGIALSPPALQICDKMRIELTNHNQSATWRLIERLLRITESRSDEKEIAEAYLEGALAYYRMKYYAEAVEFMRESVSKYSTHRHRYAVANWILGCTLWRFPDRHDEAIVTWQKSCDTFGLLRDFSTNPRQSVWYEEIHDDVVVAIADTIDNGCLPLEVRLTSDDFDHNGWIPAMHTCDGANVSPGLNWGNVPEETRSFVIIMENLDTPAASQTHWLLFDYPGNLDNLPQGVAGIGVRGVNDFGNDVYNGPCPPRGETHAYDFRLYTLNKQINLPRGSNRADVREAMIGNVVGYGRILGKYRR